MPKITKELIIDEAGKELAKYAETTAKYSGNWRSFTELATSIVRQAYEAGLAKGRNETDAKDNPQPNN